MPLHGVLGCCGRCLRKGFSQGNLCNNCKRPGHFARECPNVAVCNNCGLPGHIASECTTQARCWNCREPGHVASNCHNEGICHSCGKTGHRARDCPNSEQSGGDSRICNNCYKPGHIAADCSNDKACKNCRKTGHIARDCQNEPVCNVCNISGHLARQCPKGDSLGDRGGGGRYGGHREVICRTCNQAGHMSRDCAGPMIICHNCGGRGHMAYECPSGRLPDRGYRRYIDFCKKYAAAALFALALHQSQIHQTRPKNTLVPLEDEPIGEGASLGQSVSVSEHPQLWIHENSGLLLPVCRFLGVDEQAWHGLKETAGISSQVRHHVGSYDSMTFTLSQFLALLSEESDGTSSGMKDKEFALTKSVDAMVLSMNSNDKTDSVSEVASEPCETKQGISLKMSGEEKSISGPETETSEHPLEEEKLLTYQRKVTVLYELLSACVAGDSDGDKKCSQGKGYDARYRVALRLLSTWLNINWIKMEAIEIMVACSLVAPEQELDEKEDGNRNSESSSAIWKKGGIIGAAALAGGTLMAVTGGLAAPAIAQGLGALAPAVGSLVPAVGGGFAAAAGATGSVAGSVAVAASFGAAGASLAGTKMARRIGSIDEFEFKRLAVGIMISGLVFEEEDFVKPWESYNDNLERYALMWETKNLIALSTSIEDWLTSKVAMELMKEGAMMTILSTLLAALALPATLVTAADLIDSQWAIAVDSYYMHATDMNTYQSLNFKIFIPVMSEFSLRSDQAGMLLAEVLLKGLQGNSGVAMLIFSQILRCFASSAGLVERVVLLGAPISINNEKWEDARKMVAGRFVNAYSTNDWTLAIVYRASLLSQGLAGIQAIDIAGIENLSPHSPSFLHCVV
ncbi:hypothetical protein JRO89_XSUnG0113100 [Xanthoceras sorbifolium]|uniref:CCHC-type domain-containing protein n=1 Tax=Xanthoceras sorbifolium TaxID=99658 RepID=A0ABQ8GYF9_9ROSI|nr:hypothetical protein JRO89_XSUnG0113100 [Xanthoceras sorbifolium]